MKVFMIIHGGGKVTNSILSNDNGTKALETTTNRNNFNNSLTTIISNNGDNDSSKSSNGNKEINYNENSPERYKSTIKYEGNVSNGGFPNMNCDPIGDGSYSVSPMPKNNQLDPNTSQDKVNPYDNGMSNNCYYVNSKNNGNKYQIQADTTTAGYNLYQKWQQLVKNQGLDTIDKINLGLVEREQPDIAIKNDIFAVMVGSNTGENRQEKWFKYGEKMKEVENEQQQLEGRQNVDKSLGVKFGNNNKVGTYTREVAPSEVQAAKDTDFKVKVVYKTKIKNESSTLTMSPTEIVSYFDSKYLSDVKCVTSTPWDNNESNEVSWQVGASHQGTGTHNATSSNYKTAYGTINTTIQPQKSIDIYTEYTFEKEAALGILNNPDGSIIFYNQVEINAYTTTDNKSTKRSGIGASYAGVDSDSNPGNAKDEQSDPSLNTWQDDTDDAPDFKLQRAQNRKISGRVFKDANNDGINNSEQGIDGVQVELVELDDNGNEKLEADGKTRVQLDKNPNDDSGTIRALATTYNGGYYEFSGFIPGRYVIKFTWGGDLSTVSVQDPDGSSYLYPEQYKSTIFNNKGRYSSYINWDSNDRGESGPPRWLLINNYQVNKYQGMSNAIDDMVERKNIDDQMHIVNGSDNYVDVAEKRTVMHSRTPAFEVGVEDYGKNKESSGADTEIFNQSAKEQGTKQYLIETKDLDFGITKRPKMGMNLEKKIERVKVTLANGQILVDADVDGNNLKGVKLNSTYMSPNKGNVSAGPNGDIGYLKVEMDEEIMQGATLEITYKYIIKNTSEPDYVIDSDGNNLYELNNYINTNNYYKFGIAQGTPVSIEPTTIVDYLDNQMNYVKGAEVPENNYWERITDPSRIQARIQDFLFNFRGTTLYNKNKNKYEDYLDKVKDPAERMKVLNKYYWTLLRDQSGDASGDKISLKAGESAERKLIASKVLTSTNEDMDFYNSAEIIQMTKNGGAQPEDQIPGNSFPLEEVKPDVYQAKKAAPAKEGDSTTAEQTTITGPTGDIYHNYERGVMIAVALAGLSILGVGTAIIRRIVFTVEDRKQKVKKQKDRKHKKIK